MEHFFLSIILTAISAVHTGFHVVGDGFVTVCCDRYLRLDMVENLDKLSAMERSKKYRREPPTPNRTSLESICLPYSTVMVTQGIDIVGVER